METKLRRVEKKWVSFALFLLIMWLGSVTTIKASNSVIDDLNIKFANGWIVERTYLEDKDYLIATSPDKKYQVAVSSYEDDKTLDIWDFNKFSYMEIEEYLEKYFSFSYDAQKIIKEYNSTIKKFNSSLFIQQDVIREYEKQNVCERQLFTVKNGKGIVISIHSYGAVFDEDLKNVFGSIMFVEETTYISFKKVFVIVCGIGMLIIAFLVTMIIYHSKVDGSDDKYFA